MVCARCGTTFEGRFCPNCGTPATPATLPAPFAAPSTPYYRCGRCGTTYSGKFCPTCGLPAWSPWIPPPRPSNVGFSLLNVAWTFSLIAFLAVLAIATAGMFAMMPTIGRGIDAIRSGGTADRGFDSPTSWAFTPWTAIGASGSVQASGGNPGGYGEVRLEGLAGSLVGGYWSQSFTTGGSRPFAAGLTLDYKVFQASDVLGNLTVAVFIDRSPNLPDLGTDAWNITLTLGGNWTRAQSTYPPTGEVIDFIDVSSFVTETRTYYLKVAALAWNLPGTPGTPTIVGFDNVRLAWTTNAFVDVYLFSPVPVLFFATQSATVFYLWTAAIVAATVACLGALVLWDRRPLVRDLRSSSEVMPAKLRSRSATVATMQTFLAVLFLSILVQWLFSDAQEPSFFQTVPEWYILFALVNAPVYEELVFRAFLIGAPLAAGSLFFRVSDIVRGRVPAGMTKSRYLAGSLRYLIGGGMSRKTSRAVLFPAFLFLAMSSIVFGLAHGPGYGDWKILPVAVAGLAMGYLFLRHGIHAAILFHFATDVYIATITFAGFNSPLGLALSLGFIALIVPGAGFFAYYVLYVVRLSRDVLQPRGARTTPAPAAAPGRAAWGSYGQGYAGAASAAGPPPTPIPAGYAPAKRPPGYGTSPVEYRCPRCAWVEAAYENGRFRCLRCGHVT